MTDDKPSSEETPQTLQGADILSGFVGRMGKDAARYAPAIVLPAVFGFVGVAVFTRIFPPTQYGQFSIINATAGIGIWLLGGWLQQSVIRYLPRYREQNRLAEFTFKFNGILWIEVVVLAVLAVALYSIFDIGGGEYGRFYFPVVAMILVWVVFIVYSAAFQANLQSARFSFYQVAQAAGRLFFGLAYVLLVRRDVVGLVIGIALSYIVLLPLMMRDLGVPSAIRRARGAIDRGFIKQVSFYGVPIVGWMVASQILNLSDRFIINYFKGPDQVGIYSANYNMAMMFAAFVTAPILLAAEPLVINAWEGRDRDRVQAIITTFTRYFLLAALPVAVCVSAFARAIASIVFGEEFREGYVVIPLVLAALTLWHIGRYGQKIIKLVEKTHVMLLMVGICASVNVALNFVLVPRYGYFGAAVSTLVSYALYPVMMYFITKRYLSWVIPWKSAAKIVFASATAGLFWWFAGPKSVVGLLDWLWLIGTGAAGFAIYGVVLFVVGEIRDYERDVIKRKLGGLRG